MEILIEKWEIFFRRDVEHIHSMPGAGDRTINRSDVYNADVDRVDDRWKKREKCRCFGEINNSLIQKTLQLCSSHEASMNGTAGSMYNLIPSAPKVWKIINCRQKYV